MSSPYQYFYENYVPTTQSYKVDRGDLEFELVFSSDYNVIDIFDKNSKCRYETIPFIVEKNNIPEIFLFLEEAVKFIEKIEMGQQTLAHFNLKLKFCDEDNIGTINYQKFTISTAEDRLKGNQYYFTFDDDRSPSRFEISITKYADIFPILKILTKLLVFHMEILVNDPEIYSYLSDTQKMSFLSDIFETELEPVNVRSDEALEMSYTLDLIRKITTEPNYAKEIYEQGEMIENLKQIILSHENELRYLHDKFNASLKNKISKGNYYYRSHKNGFEQTFYFEDDSNNLERNLNQMKR